MATPKVVLCDFIVVCTLTPTHISRSFSSPHFGIAHVLCLGLAPWLAAEIPYLIGVGALKSDK